MSDDEHEDINDWIRGARGQMEADPDDPLDMTNFIRKVARRIIPAKSITVKKDGEADENE